MAILDKHRIYTIPDACGGSLTGVSITGLTPTRYENMALTEYNLARVIAESAESRAVGLIPTALSELLMNRIKEIGKGEIQTKKIGRQSIILPYTYRRRKTRIASEYFNIVAGAVNPNAGTTTGGISYPTSSWDVNVTVGPSYRASNLAQLERYFLPGQYIYIESFDSVAAPGARTSYMTAHKIINSVNVNATTAKVTIAANYSTAGWAALSGPQKAVYQPVIGVVQVGTNSVADQESWCYNEVAENSNSLLVDWHQTSRYTQCHNDEYDRVLKAIVDGEINSFASDFQYLSLVEQNKIMRQKYEKKWMTSVFYGQRITELQSPETYDQLPQVTDPDDGTVYEYKANALGLRTLLANENQVFDALGGPIDVDLLIQLSYQVQQVREQDGGSVDVVDWMTDKDTAQALHQAFIGYMRDMYGIDTTRFFSSGEVIDQTTKFAKFKYNRYDIPGYGFQIAIFSDRFFTDRVTNFGNGTGGVQGAVDLRSRGRSIWAIDWSDFNIGLIATNQAKREYKGDIFADANPLYSCVITPNTKHYELRSQTWTTQLGDAERSFIYENYDLTACPTLTVSACAPGS